MRATREQFWFGRAAPFLARHRPVVEAQTAAQRFADAARSNQSSLSRPRHNTEGRYQLDATCSADVWLVGPRRLQSAAVVRKGGADRPGKKTRRRHSEKCRRRAHIL